MAWILDEDYVFICKIQEKNATMSELDTPHFKSLLQGRVWRVLVVSEGFGEIGNERADHLKNNKRSLPLGEIKTGEGKV